MPAINVSNMKVADLKRELKVRGLSISGNKNELQERLQAAMEGEPLLEDSSIAGEDILDEEGVLSDEEKILGADENELLKSPAATPTTGLPKTINSENKDSSVIEDDILESPTTAGKKVILKRKSSINIGASLEGGKAKENTEPSSAKAVEINDHNPIAITEVKKSESEHAGITVTKKLKEMTMQERLELRAKKFGLEIKATSAAITAKEKNEAISSAPIVSNEKQVELLKKRAERFGCVTSTNLAKLDAEERLLKRKQRFGGEVDKSIKSKITENDNASNLTTTIISSDITSNKDEWVEKARKRLERFKTNPTSKISIVATPTATPITTSHSST